MKVVQGVYPGVTTKELDSAAETAAYATCTHPDYQVLAARIAVSNLHKETTKQFSHVVQSLYDYINPETNAHAPLVSEEVCKFVNENAAALDSAIVFDRDFNYSYFGFKTLERSYLLRLHGNIVERPQHMIMRVAVGIHLGDLDKILETYELMSEGWFTHATPTLFNSGTPKPKCLVAF